jgi:drug/metabolite transporter (DMT)-like permease
MNRFQAVQLGGFSLMLALGQVLFKRAADTAPKLHGVADLLLLGTNVFIWGAVALYGVATLLWIYLLQKLPLSRAYPAVALRFVLVPLLACLLLGDEITLRYGLGAALILGGIWLTANASASAGKSAGHG